MKGELMSKELDPELDPAVFDKIKSIIAERLSIDESKIEDTSSFIEDLGADSLDTVELIMQMEEAFNVQIPDEDTEKIQTVGDAVRYIQEHVNK